MKRRAAVIGAILLGVTVIGCAPPDAPTVPATTPATTTPSTVPTTTTTEPRVVCLSVDCPPA